MQTDDPTPGHPALAALARAALLAAGVALVAMAAVEAWQVFARYVLNDSPGWTEPLALFLLYTAMTAPSAATTRIANTSSARPIAGGADCASMKNPKCDRSRTPAPAPRLIAVLSRNSASGSVQPGESLST